MYAELIVSAAGEADFPDVALPEVAIAGRSNVGKSSLINALTGCRGLARTSADPGRTRLLNFFLVKLDRANRRAVRLVDLPGYGYAKVSRATRDSWGPLIEGYLSRRANLQAVVLLVDIRRGAEVEERELTDYVRSIGRHSIIVATKVDKLGTTHRVAALRELGRALGLEKPPIAFSAHTGEGREDLWRAIRRASLTVGAA